MVITIFIQLLGLLKSNSLNIFSKFYKADFPFIKGIQFLSNNFCSILVQYKSDCYAISLIQSDTIWESCLLSVFSDGCHSLHVLNISWCTKITNDGLEALSKGCHNLHTFIGKGLSQVRRPTNSHLGDLY